MGDSDLLIWENIIYLDSNMTTTNNISKLLICDAGHFVKLREIEGQRVDSGSRLSIVNC